MKKKVEEVCRNCMLYNKVESTCDVVLLHEGEKYNIAVEPNDKCHWDRIEEEISTELKQRYDSNKNKYFKEKLIKEIESPLEIKQVRVWSDGKNGYIES